MIAFVIYVFTAIDAIAGDGINEMAEGLHNFFIRVTAKNANIYGKAFLRASGRICFHPIVVFVFTYICTAVIAVAIFAIIMIASADGLVELLVVLFAEIAVSVFVVLMFASAIHIFTAIHAVAVLGKHMSHRRFIFFTILITAEVTNQNSITGFNTSGRNEV